MGVPRSGSPPRGKILQKKATSNKTNTANGKNMKQTTATKNIKETKTKKVNETSSKKVKATNVSNKVKQTATKKVKGTATKETVVRKKKETATKKTNETTSEKPPTKNTKAVTKKAQIVQKKPAKATTKQAKNTDVKPKEQNVKPAAQGTKRGRPTKDEVEEQARKRAKVTHVSHPSHLKEGGVVLALGEGDTGQLGLGPDVMERTKPGKVNIPEDVIQICAGGMHTVCLTKEGAVYTWGCNDEGALGRTTADEDECMEPGIVDLPKDDKVVQVSAGDSHSVALSDKGKIYAWGTFRDATGSIGLTIDGKSQTPIDIAPQLTVTRIASGCDHIACITTDGELYTFGNAEQGQLGRVAECFSNRGGRKGLRFLLTPGQVHTKKRKAKFTNVWTGAYVTYAYTSTGDIFTWGLNNYFQLGFADMKNRYVPDYASSFSNKTKWKEIAGGQHHTIALDNDGKVYSLGRKEYGRLGLGEDTEEKAAPTVVQALEGKKCVNIACGTAVSMAVTEGGEVYAWGMGTSRQLGQTEEDDLWEPVCMKGKQLENRRSLQVTSGGQHTVILAQDLN